MKTEGMRTLSTIRQKMNYAFGVCFYRGILTLMGLANGLSKAEGVLLNRKRIKERNKRS